MINPTLEYHNYLSVLNNIKKKMNITRIRTNSHELQSETELCFIPKTPQNIRIRKIYDTKQEEDEKNFLLDYYSLTHIHSQFPNIYHASNILDLLSQPTYSDLGMLLSILFDHKNKILKYHI